MAEYPGHDAQRRGGPFRRGDACPLDPLPTHPLYVRITHWVNALAVIVMIGSGWLIYDASPLFGFAFPRAVTLGRDLAGALELHFAAMWLFLANGLLYMGLGVAGGHFARKFLPISLADAFGVLGDALKGRLRHDGARYNGLQRILYAAILATGAIIVASGLAVWKPVQLRELAALFGGYEGARRVHFLAMAVISLFLVVHVAMAVLVPKTLRAMILGR